MESILSGIKKNLGIDASYEVFDPDILMHINSVFSTLHQLGIGPVDGFEIEDETATWDSFLNGEKRLNFVKSYMHKKIQLLFDPPANSFATEAIKSQISEFEYRINLFREEKLWVDSNPPAESP